VEAVWDDQAGVVTRSQALAAGVSPSKIRSLLERGAWRARYGGIYLTFSEPAPRLSIMWATVLAAGEGAALSHYSAAELAGFGEKRRNAVHVTIPHHRRVDGLPDVILHRSRRLDADRHPIRMPPQTRVEATALDLASVSGSLDEAIGWLTSACSRRLTTPERLLDGLEARQRVRWRRELKAAIGDIGSGAQSLLELRYLRRVERAHGLPAGKRQARLGGHIYDDVRYPAFCLVVELDGRVSHAAEATFRDLARDNVAAIRSDVVLHYGWDDVTESPCRVAEQVAGVLAKHGWTGHPRRCRLPNCVIGEPGC
jgi:very-short-patch-repair endonuclease